MKYLVMLMLLVSSASYGATDCENFAYFGYVVMTYKQQGMTLKEQLAHAEESITVESFSENYIKETFKGIITSAYEVDVPKSKFEQQQHIDLFVKKILTACDEHNW